MYHIIAFIGVTLESSETVLSLEVVSSREKIKSRCDSFAIVYTSSDVNMANAIRQKLREFAIGKSVERLFDMTWSLT